MSAVVFIARRRVFSGSSNLKLLFIIIVSQFLEALILTILILIQANSLPELWFYLSTDEINY